MKMKAVVLQEFGGVENFVDEQWQVADPQGKEVLVRIRAASVNPVDFKTRKGYLGGEPPMVLGVDMAGVVEEVGDEVKDLRSGDEVYGFIDAEGPASNGAYAEYVTVPRSFLAPKPAGLSFPEAAALAMVGLTAYQCLVDKAGVRPGESVFIAGGSGAVGAVAVQLARYFHAGPILTTAGSRESLDYLTGPLGLDGQHIIDYRHLSLEELAEEVVAANNGKAVDAAFDFVGGDMKRLCCEVIDFDGRVTTIVEEDDDFRLHAVSGQKSPLLSRSASLHTQLLLARARFGPPPYWDIFAEELATLAKLVEQGHILAHRILMLEDFSAKAIAEAHTRLEGRHVNGKLVIPIV